MLIINNLDTKFLNSHMNLLFYKQKMTAQNRHFFYVYYANLLFLYKFSNYRCT